MTLLPSDGYVVNLGTSLVMGTVSLSLGAVGLIIQCAIGQKTCSRRIDRTQIRHKFWFGVALLCSLVSTIAHVLRTVFKMWSFPDSTTDAALPLIHSAIIVAMCYFWTMLLVVLVVRLSAMFKMAKCWSMAFVVIFLFLFASPIAMVMDFPSDSEYPDWIRILLGVLVLFFFAVFFIGALLAVVVLMRNLRKISKAHQVAMWKVDIGEKERASDEQNQHDRVRAVRYMLLFIIAIISNCFFVSLAMAVDIDSGLRAVPFAANYCLNLFALYLQFHFAEERYERLCGCIDRRLLGSVHKEMGGSDESFSGGGTAV